MSQQGCKVDDAVEAYSLRAPGTDAESIHGYLVAKWTGRDGYRSVGYRKLADWFNRRLFRRVYDDHGRSTTGTRVDSEYEALTGDDDLVREEVINDLKADGIDAESLLEATVSPRTMHRHLTNCLDAEKAPREAETDWERESVERAREQLAEKVTKAASALASKAEFHGADEAEVEVRVYLSCPECATRVTFEAGRRQGYVCEAHSPTPADVDLVADSTADDAAGSAAGTNPVVGAVSRFSS